MSEHVKSGNFFKDLITRQKQNKETPEQEKPKNKFFTPEEWFERYYRGQKTEELPERVFKDVSPEDIKILEEKYSSRLPKKNPEVKQIDLFD